MQKLSTEYLGDSAPWEQMKNIDIKSKIPDISWNKSVETTFDFISKSPTLLKELATQVSMTIYLETLQHIHQLNIFVFKLLTLNKFVSLYSYLTFRPKAL